METVGGFTAFMSSLLSTGHLGCDLWIYRWTCFHFDESITLPLGFEGYTSGVVTLFIHKSYSQLPILIVCLALCFDLFLSFNSVLVQARRLFLAGKPVLFAYCIIESKINKFIHKCTYSHQIIQQKSVHDPN